MSESMSKWTFQTLKGGNISNLKYSKSGGWASADGNVEWQ